MASVEVLAGPERRRRWRVEQKQAIVAAAFRSGAVVRDVARQADVTPSLVYRWRRDLPLPRPIVEPPPIAAAQSAPSPPGLIANIAVILTGAGLWIPWDRGPISRSLRRLPLWACLRRSG